MNTVDGEKKPGDWYDKNQDGLVSILLAMLPYKTTALTFSGCGKVAMRIEAVVVTHLCINCVKKTGRLVEQKSGWPCVHSVGHVTLQNNRQR